MPSFVPRTTRSNRRAGLIALHGTLAPEGALLKRAAATPALLEHEGRAIVFASLDDLAARIDDPDLDVAAQDVLVLQNAGPKSPFRDAGSWLISRYRRSSRQRSKRFLARCRRA